ncbi:MAG: PqqD family protein [Deltaproteobacteria bacterium]|nr:PqqD family protein [Deltaproteobacteria bacterium]
MEGLASRVRLNDQEAVAKIIDGEAILINLVSGVYYSMDGTGAVIWSLIQAGEPVERMAASLAASYDVTLEQAAIDIEAVVRELLEQRLVVPDDVPSSFPTAPVAAGNGTKLPYVAPALNAYTDMGDLLALDPPVPGFNDISWEK